MDHDEMRRIGDRCVQDDLPLCAAHCPLHVDARGLVTAISRGDFDGALEIYTKKVIFPDIISRICDHPCQEACRRKEAGEALAINALERACVELGHKRVKKNPFFVRKKIRVAVVGGGLSGMAAAMELSKKGYEVALFEARERLGGRLWKYPAALLPPEVILEETALIAKAGIAVRLNHEVGTKVSLDELCSEFPAVYLGIGEPQTGSLKISSAPVTFATEREGVFAGGSLRRSTGPDSPSTSLADGYRAVLSIDRYIKKVSLTSGRESEGVSATCLYTSTGQYQPLSVVQPASGRNYSRTEAMAEAARCFPCNCLECVKACDLLERFENYPKNYIREICKNIIIQPGFGLRSATKLINGCTLCGLCGQICPEEIGMDAICLSARQQMVDKGYMPLTIHDFPVRDMVFSNSDSFALVRHQPGKPASQYLFFPGCQLSASMPEQVMQSYAYLSGKLEGGVGLMLRCCGAPALWAGRRELFREALNQYLALWQEMGKPILILACPTCYKIFKEHLPQVTILSLWDVFAREGLPDRAASSKALVVAVHDPCTAREEQEMQESVRRILEQLGCQVEELHYSRRLTECCGFGGLVSFVNADLAARMVKRRVEESPHDYVTYCSNCRDNLASGNKATWHLLDLIFGDSSRESALRRGPNLTQRRDERVSLKNRFLKEVWGESIAGRKDCEAITLNISSQVRDVLEKRMILDDDIKQVIAHAEGTGQKLLDQKAGHLIAHLKPSLVTYWVEYLPERDGYIIYNAYSHRIQVREEVAAQ
ncbi:Glutamate synthase (NADPH) small chain [Pelotomaculum schinkii]|uniref:Glutamate synthase (NADPH) small chain n=1 Tax=Pelotomaculum schinkii TaxID=78350 RepID=A0A4Y7RFN4_9FIRM|nr:pyridine nucleotide-disulfide oxidoreductase/dicluster-binding protein [Pelotomaculum schinkii]TEB07599.1 Glutamate synthase (NADPH) small chain [Pelotomaculum schinkii]